MTPPSVSKKAMQANRVPVWGWGRRGKEKAERQRSEQNLTEKHVTHGKEQT